MDSRKPVAASPRDPTQRSDAPTRESQVRERDEPLPTPTNVQVDREIRETRKRAVTLRNQGWRWELQGRAAAFREAADQVKKWLLEKGGPPSEADVRWVVKLLEQSAEVYEAGGEPAKKPEK